MLSVRICTQDSNQGMSTTRPPYITVGLLLTLPTLTSPRSRLDPCSSAQSWNCCISSSPENCDLAGKDKSQPQASPELQVCLPKTSPGKQLSRDPKSHILKTYFLSRRDFRDPSSDLVDWRVICLLPIRLCVSENKVRDIWQNPALFSKATSCCRGLWARKQ